MDSATPFNPPPNEISGLRAELEELRRENARLQVAADRWWMMVENEPECVKIVARDGTLLEINPAGLAILQARSVAEARARPLVEFVAPEHRRAFAELHRRVMQGEQGTLQFAVIGLQGQQRWLETHAIPQTDNCGHPVALLAITQDITAYKRATEALREAELRFRLLAENIKEVFWLIEPDGKLLYASPSFDRIWGRGGERLDRRPATWLPAVHPADRDRIAHALAERQPTGEFHEEYRIVQPDGSIRWVRERTFPVTDELGQVYQVVGVTEDITEGKELEERFLHAQRREAIGTLATGVAHDLNNILAPILMAGALLRGSVGTDGERHLTEMIERNAQRGADVVRQLLALSRGAPANRRRVPPGELIEEIAAIVRATFPRRIALHLDVAAPLWDVDADPTQLHQVLLNLCVNARDAMPGSGALTISGGNEVVAENELRHREGLKPGRYLVLSVGDTGCGISAEIRARIFEPFFTTKPPGEGTGLGLSTVASIVRNHGGAVTVESELGRGTTFRVFLPALASAAKALRIESPPPVRGKGELVLVVDDEPGVRGVLCALLQHGGYRTVAAENGEEALRLFLLRRAEVQLVISDLVMPVMDGVAFIRAVRGLEPELPIIAAGGSPDPTATRELAELQVTELLVKPWRPYELLAAVQRLLSARE